MPPCSTPGPWYSSTWAQWVNFQAIFSCAYLMEMYKNIIDIPVIFFPVGLMVYIDTGPGRTSRRSGVNFTALSLSSPPSAAYMRQWTEGPSVTTINITLTPGASFNIEITPSGREFSDSKTFTFTRTPVLVSKMNAVARAQLTFQIVILLQKYLYRQSQCSKTWNSQCLALIAQ